MIIDGQALAAQLFGGRVRGPRSFLRGFGYQPPSLDQVAITAAPLLARINHGIWMASCPCGAPGLPAPGGVVFLKRPLIWCPRCENAEVGGAWRPVTVPKRTLRKRIESILLLRPNAEDRNWEGPDELVADLITQNLEHGDPIPEAA